MAGLNVQTYGGGIFSHFHQFLENLLRIDSSKFSQLRLVVNGPSPIKTLDIFDSVFSYQDPSSFETLPNTHHPVNSFLKVNEFARFHELKTICSKITFHPFITDDYFKKTAEFLSTHEIKRIFIASDNEESISIFIENFPEYEILWFHEGIRCSSSSDDNFKFQLDNLNNPEFIQKNVIEALILAKCSFLIHRISDFANFAILFSDTYEEIHCL